MDTKDYITITVVTATLILSFINLLYSIKNNRKTIFINTVTKLRSEWLVNMKKRISKLLSTFHCIIQNPQDMQTEETTNMIEELTIIRYEIALNLNLLDQFDSKYIKFIDNMVKQVIEYPQHKNIKSINKDLEILTTVSQGLTKLEWEGIKMESKKGILSKKDKSILRQKFLSKYEDMLDKGLAEFLP